MRAQLAIDQSTSATKAVLFDSDGTVLHRFSCEHRQYYPAPGLVEHDAEEIWRNVLAASGAVLAKAPAAITNLRCVSIANQRETVVVFDRRTGNPLMPAIVWQCRRGTPLCAAQRDLGRNAAVMARTGLPIDGYFSASKLQWIVRNVPEVAARLASREALCGTIDTYLIYRLTRGAVFATDHTNASRTLLYNLHTRKWDEELCEWWQVPRGALAEILSSDAHFGETDLGGSLARSVPICGVMGDSQAALFSQRCLETGSAKVTFGTGSSILVNTGSEFPRPSVNALAALAWVRAGEAVFALEGLVNSSAATLSWLRNQLGVLDDIGDAERVSREVGDAGSVYLVPAFSGLGAPYWRDDARAAIIGLTAHSDRRHLVRAALESIAYQLRDVIDAMRAETRLELQELRADGGPTTNGLLMQFVADVLRVNLRVTCGSDSSASGAALMGALATGAATSAADFNMPGDEVIYQPRMSAARAQERYAGWQRAVSQVLYGALNS
jgi:glycerol kinase